MTSVADTADALREGIARGYLDVADAIRWAQVESVADRDELDPLLPYLARSEHRPTSHILLILSQLAWGADAAAVGRIALVHLHDRLTDGRIDTRTTAAAMYHLLRDGYAPDDEFESAARRFDDEVARAERTGASLDRLAASMVAYLARYRGEPAPRDDATDAGRDHLTIAADSADDDSIEITARLEWQWWAGRARVRARRDELEHFAARLRDFATHGALTAELACIDETGARLTLAVREYGRARRASLAVAMVDPVGGGGAAEAPAAGGSGRPATALDVQVPTEHELVGDFAADLAELVATGGGVARLRLLGRWQGRG